MVNASARRDRLTPGALWRLACTLVSIVIVETIVCGSAVMPVVLIWRELTAGVTPDGVVRTVVFSLLLVPSYIAFALCLMIVSALATWVTAARTPQNAEMAIADMGWPLMRWVRYMVASHVVRVLAGTLFRGSPIGTAYRRLNGARIGKRVYVNTLFISDHNLLELDEGVVIGSEAHVSGHTVEDGIVKTAGVHLGRNVTIGLGTVIDIGVVVGAGSQVGALSLVPKHTSLEPGVVFAGIPVRRIDRQAPAARPAALP
jgi:acetyltransferase-like isoleucine patch superfamily enzyme